ncbi:MAG: regulatory iron-sulfur-containing complex subunit RicT [Planctomycetota bacterium]
MKYLIIARYGVMAQAGSFIARSCDYKRAEQLILRTPRGTEIGEFMVLKQELVLGMREETDGKVIGIASEEEISRMKRIRSGTQMEELRYCRERIRVRNLPMRLKFVEHILGGERVTFYFTAEQRVDFRDLVKDLAEQFKTRIEMKQIGARDEARLLEECGICGMSLCCRLVLPKIEPVSMKMAKIQTSTLDPAKVSGRCGRLKCCFRYEHAVYRELGEGMPMVGDIVRTKAGEAEVIDLAVLAQRVRIRTGGPAPEVSEIPLADIIEVRKR